MARGRSDPVETLPVADSATDWTFERGEWEGHAAGIQLERTEE